MLYVCVLLSVVCGCVGCCPRRRSTVLRLLKLPPVRSVFTAASFMVLVLTCFWTRWCGCDDRFPRSSLGCDVTSHACVRACACFKFVLRCRYGLPNPQFHAWWHVLVGISSYCGPTFLVFQRACVKRDDHAFIHRPRRAIQSPCCLLYTSPSPRDRG